MRNFSWSKPYTMQESLHNVEPADLHSNWLSLALQSAKMCAYKWDLETNIVTRAKQSIPHSGLHEHADSWMVRDGLAYVHPDDRDRVIGDIDQAINSEKEFNIEFRVNMPGEKTRWLLTKGHAVYGDHGVAHYVFAITQEITDRKIAELYVENQKRELELKKSQLDIALEAADMIVLADLHRNSHFVSPEMCRLYGIENENTLLNREIIFAKIHPDDRERVRNGFDWTYANGGMIRDEHRIVLPNGEVRWVMIKGAHLKKYGDGRHFIVLQDITPLKTAQEQIAQKQQELSILSNSMPNLAWIADNSGAFIWVNERYVEYSGIPASELLGWGYLKIHHPDFLETTFKKKKECLETGLPWEDTFPLLNRDNKWRWFLSRGEAIRDSQNKIVYWVGTNTDITSEREHIKNLEGQKIIREEFTSTLTHDLRNPLSVISMAVKLALRDETDPHRKGQLLHRAQETIERMDKMIADLLNANLLNAGQQILFEMSFFDIAKLLKQIIDDFSIRFGSRFDFVGSESTFGYWNEDALRRVFENLFTNAVKYGDQKSKITITLRAHANEKSITIDVHNYGPTIPTSDLKDIFEMHRRAGVSDHRKQSGWGIGLTLVRGLVTSHGGSVTAASEENSGTTFKVFLPMDARSDQFATNSI